MKPRNAEVARRLAHHEIDETEAARLRVPESSVEPVGEKSQKQRFTDIWEALLGSVDMTKSDRNFGYCRTFPSIVRVDTEGSTTSFLLTFDLDSRDPQNRDIKAVWEYLPPLYKPQEDQQTFRRAEVINERLISSGCVDGFLDIVESSFQAYVETSPASTPATT
ncbi:MAG TPA: hypothetical protein VIH90_05960 [Candidatus Saccharimonadales bacterium]